MVEQRDGFQMLITHEKDELGRYKCTRIDVRHITTGDSTSFWTNQLESLGDSLKKWEAEEADSVERVLS